MQYGFHFNGRRCTGCKTCVLACKDFHDLPSDIAFRQVYEYGGGTWRRADDGTVTQDTFAYHLSVACNHCGNAACVRVCPTGAMHKDERGLVRVDADRCIGCGYCALSCPYRAPKVDRVAGRSAKCDGCAERVAEGRQPICVEACPLRALDFGPIDELRAAWGTVADVPPLPAATATAPNLVVSPPRIFKDDPGRVRAEGRVQNAREIV
ncbi:DMSO/selenate family reductase complex B subunit [Adlercreutzia caecimuris]|uniref:Dimethylsulfoxide reductase, chain B n=1 Tax=Adlercreutzia caecimuris B7 TaxID=1235794 RepID=R9KT22_9ACTN|nr:DMSO/selenate family reductase complex B subunit [Adlercreutzia caecimuris]EOS49684.1 dimethylsulfoxide reductase, chain B [Adlercreutzia caecimuris B7]